MTIGPSESGYREVVLHCGEESMRIQVGLLHIYLVQFTVELSMINDNQKKIFIFFSFKHKL